MKQRILLVCVATWILSLASAGATDPAAQAPADETHRPTDGQIQRALTYPAPIGKHIRVTDGRTWHYGRLGHVGRDTLILRTDTSGGSEVLVRIPRSSVRDMQVRTGPHSHSGTGALVGGIIGCAAGAVAGGVVIGGWADDPASGGAGGALLGGILGTCVGAGLGAALGATVQTYGWQDVPLGRMQIGMITRPRTPAAVGLTIHF